MKTLSSILHFDHQNHLIFSIFLFIFSISFVFGDVYEESIRIKSLPKNYVYTHLEFTVKDVQLSNHSRYFPRALAEILSTHNVQELHLSLTQGHWRFNSWGEPETAAPTGALVTSWFNAKDSSDADQNWKGLTSRLSGMTCSSLNFLDKKTSIEPVFGYKPKGKITLGGNGNLFVRVGALPKENVCTENLTPWTKLLPCGISQGLASLLRSKQVFNTHYHSEGIHFIKKDKDNVELKLTLSMVYSRPNNLKPTDSFARKVIGALAIFPCHPASKTIVEIWKNGQWKNFENTFNLNGITAADIPLWDESKDVELIFTPMKYIGGYGQEYGELIVEMTNHLKDRSLPVLYVEVLPWYIRPYLHTMRMEVNKSGNKVPVEFGNQFHYTPGRDRKVLHKLEMDFLIPAKSTITLSFLVEKGHLKWDEYPPDANHGFYLEAAHFEVNYTSTDIRSYFTRILLINLSTPDFSMPYNVICLTCTVVALAFGPIHNITTKVLQLQEVKPRKTIKEHLKGVKKYLYKLIGKKENEEVEEEKEEKKPDSVEEKEKGSSSSENEEEKEESTKKND